jgi:uncharacterized protein YndB with AHSA1/START domain
MPKTPDKYRAVGEFGPKPEGKLFEDGTIVFERLLPGPLERVWSYIVDGGKRAKWLNSGDMAKPGTATMTFNHTALSGEVAPEDYAAMREPISFDVEVLKVEPLRHVTFTWPEGDEAPHERPTVSIDLSPVGDGVLLRLTHRNPRKTSNVKGYLDGWHSHLAILEDVMAGVPPRPFWTTHAAIKASYRQQLEGKTANTVAVEVETTFKARPQKVFKAWLDPATIAQFMIGPDVRKERLLHVELDPVPGGAFSYKVDREGEIIDHVGHFYDVQPPMLLSFSWGIAGFSDPRESRVTIRIAPTAAGCVLTLTHDMAAQWADYAGRTRDGWAFMLEKLAQAI